MSSIKRNIGNLSGQVEKAEEAPAKRGGSAIIWRGRWVRNRNDEVLAIKVVLDESVQPPGATKSLAKEMDIWTQLSHPNILELYGSTVDSKQFGNSFPALVSPWCQHGSLRDLLNSMQGELDRSLRFSIIRDFTKGLRYMHTAPIGPVMHGDLKAANVLIADGFVAKIADFGLSRTVLKASNDPTMTVQGPGTLRWMAPEAHQRMVEDLPPERPTWPADIWAWGYLVYETVTNKLPYYQYRNDFLVSGAIQRGELSPRPADDDPESDAFLTTRFWPLLERCWSMTPRKRPEITMIVQDPLFDENPVQHGDPLVLFQDPSMFGSARRYRERGDIAFRREAYREAFDYYERARQSFERIDDKRRTALCLHDLGWTHMRLDNNDEAQIRFSQSRDLYRAIGDIKGELDALQDIAVAERAMGNLDRSRDYLQRAYEGCRQARLFTRSGWCLVGLGLLNVDIQDWEAAHRRFDHATEIAAQE
ncbi:hypothetical protein FRC07_007547, partial [Ceratobasidium sp. 392]